MALDARFLHWQQARDDELLSDEDASLAHADEAVPQDTALDQERRWEARAQALTVENAALREDEPWPSL